MRAKLLCIKLNIRRVVIICLMPIVYLTLTNTCFLIWRMYGFFLQPYLTFRSQVLLIDTEGCKIPVIHPLYIPESQEIPLDCGRIERPLVTTGNNPLYPSLQLHRDVITDYGKNVRCFYNVIRRKTDFITNIETTLHELKDEVTLIRDEFIRVECLDNNKTSVFEEFFPFIQRKPEVEERCQRTKRLLKDSMETESKLSVLFMIIDSVSRNHYLKQMKKTNQYIHQHFPLVEMKGFNKFGADTFDILTALLTGYSLEDLDEFLNKSFTKPLDPLPFIWNDFSANGYRNLFSEEMPAWGTFQFRSGGFHKQPTDYYYRPFTFVFDNRNITTPSKMGCVKSQQSAELLLKWTRDFFDVFASDPLFALSKLTLLSHNSLVTLYQYDEPVLNFFKHLHEKNHMNRTIVFFMGDHGYKHSEERITFVGRMEAKLPFLHVIFPKWFRTKYPKAIVNLKRNSDKLVTVLDIHSMLEDILKFPHTMNRWMTSRGRSVSLFRGVVSEKRTCDEAKIFEQFCACDQMQPISLYKEQVQMAAVSMINKINSVTKYYRSSCSYLKLQSIISAGFRKVISDDKKLDSLNYQLSIQVSPGGGMFEGMVSDLKNGTLKVDDHIERVNTFGHQGDCVRERFIKPYCYCRQ